MPVIRAAIETSGLGKSYGRLRVLDGISTSIPTGEVVGLLGHNGAGKTTFLKLVLGLIRPTTGTLKVLDLSASGIGARAIHRRIGYLPENVAFYPSLTARETITYLANLKKRPRTEGIALLERVGLNGAADRRVQTFSKGMRQRLGLAQALLGEPEILLLDEPTAGLDPLAIGQFLRMIRELRAHGKTILVSSHLLAELEAHLDRAVILAHGRIVAEGTIEGMRREVDLPIGVRVRFADGAPARALESALPAMLVAQTACDHGEITLSVPRAQKLGVIHQLTAMPDLIDISVEEPRLPEIYAKISAAETAARGEDSA